MNIHINNNISKALFCLLFVSGSLLAVEDEDQNTQERVSVGERQMAHSEWTKILEGKARFIRSIERGEIVSKEGDPQLSEEEQQELLKGQDALAASDEREEQGESKASFQASVVINKGIKATTYYTSHEGAYHRPIGVSLLGDSVELEDGSIWSVSSSHRLMTLDWMSGDIIIILPNQDWFSSYSYRLVNINTGAKIKVNLSLGPIYNGVYTHWILAIDYFHREVCLEDGSIWKMSSLDSSVLNKWLPNDTVIIGTNDGWFSGSNPNMLINVNMNNHAAGKCIY